MRKTIKKIIISLSAAAISTSCSLALVNNENEALEGDHKIVISGAVSELGTNNPLQGIKVTLQALPANVLYPLPILTLSEYTDNNGTYLCRTLFDKLFIAAVGTCHSRCG